MGLFSKDKKTETAIEAVETKAAPPANAQPQRSRFYDSLRTNAFTDQNPVAPFVELWTAMQTDPEKDTWHVMKYTMFNIEKDENGQNKPDAIFKSEAVFEGVSFFKALTALGEAELAMGSMHGNYKPTDMEAQYGPDKVSDGTQRLLQQYYYDLPFFKDAANIEGVAFNQYNEAFPRVQGKIFATATFEMGALTASIIAPERAVVDPALKGKMEEGILSDISRQFNAASVAPSFENILKAGEILITFDKFAAQFGGLYLSVQDFVQDGSKYAKIDAFASEEARQKAYKAALPHKQGGDSLLDHIPVMKETLKTAEKQGALVEPFAKLVAEAEVYIHLVQASKNTARLRGGLSSSSQVDIDLITEIRSQTDAAAEKFFQLGGQKKEVDALLAWVSNEHKEDIPQWIPRFLTRYHQKRNDLSQQMQRKPQSVNVIANDIKPMMTSDQAFKPATTPKP